MGLLAPVEELLEGRRDYVAVLVGYNGTVVEVRAIPRATNMNGLHQKYLMVANVVLVNHEGFGRNAC